MAFIEQRKYPVIAATMGLHQGEAAKLMGYFQHLDTKTSPPIMSVKTTDDVYVRATLSVLPFETPVQGSLVELIGVVQSAKTFDCRDLVTFPKELADTFDAKLHNDAIKELDKHFGDSYFVNNPEEHLDEAITITNDDLILPSTGGGDGNRTFNSSQGNYSFQG